MKLPLIVFLFLLAIQTSCVVSQRKYDEAVAERMRLEAELGEAEERIATLEANIEQLKEDLQSAQNKNRNLEEQLGELENQLAAAREAYDELDQQYNNLLANSGQLNRDLAAQRQRVSELEQIIEDKEQAVRELRNKVMDALLNYGENDLSVNIKNGKVYVSLAEQLLFQSGSIKVDPKGVTALQQLAGVLKANPDINILIEGHTDDVPVSRTSQYMKDNWDLSVMRATSISRILIEAGVDPARITAAGRGEFQPVASNESREDRALNRRTEIILTPDLNELFQILE